MCDQQSLRSACANAQSDQSLCLSLEYSMSVKLLNEHHLEFLRLKGDCTGSSESTLVKMPHCWKSRHGSLFFFLHFHPPSFCPDEFSVTTGRIVLKFGDIVDMNVKLCNRVSKCWTLRLAHGRAQNHPNFAWTNL